MQRRVSVAAMSFVKLDCGMLESSLWIDREGREIFITALLMASPHETREPMPEINPRDLGASGFVVPPGWYGFVAAASVGIIRRAGIEKEAGFLALERLAAPDPESRTELYEGRRMVRVNGGYVILNFDTYRKKDHSAAERSRRYREKQAASRVTTRCNGVITRSVTQAEAEAEAEAEKKAPRPLSRKRQLQINGQHDAQAASLRSPSPQALRDAQQNPNAMSEFHADDGEGSF